MTTVAQERPHFNTDTRLQLEKHRNTPAYQSIVASNIQPGEGDVVATCDLKVGGLLIRRVKVRRGRQGATYVNLPSVRLDDLWTDTIEFTSKPLEAACYQAVLAAVAEATR